MWVWSGPCGVVIRAKLSLACRTPLLVVIFGNPSVVAIVRIADSADWEMNGSRARSDANSSSLDFLSAGGMISM